MKVLSLGAGVQSSTLFLMMCYGEYEKPDFAIFADTGGEPDGVYTHLEFLKKEGEKHGLPLVVVQYGNLEEDMLKQRDGKRFASVPLYLKNEDGEEGSLRRQCTSEYKLRPMQKYIREELKKRGIKQAEMFLGISTDEVYRMKPSRVKYIKHRWPLIEDLKMDRSDCLAWWSAKGMHRPPRSACVFCPFHNDNEWQRLKYEDKSGWDRAVKVDAAIREQSRIKGNCFLHRQMVPLDQVTFEGDTGQLDLFNQECEGMCGL